MSDPSGNIDLVRQGYEAFARGDVAGVLANWDPKIEWTEAAGHPYGGRYTGPDAVVSGVFTPTLTEFDDFALAADRIIGQDDIVVATGSYSGTHKETGRTFEARFAHIWEIRDGKAVRFEQIADTAKIRESMHS